MVRCCSSTCAINNGNCDKQHKCFICKAYLHMLCGHDYYDSDGNVVEDLGFPKVCDKCHGSNPNGPSHKKKRHGNGEVRANLQRKEKESDRSESDVTEKSSKSRKKTDDVDDDEEDDDDEDENEYDVEEFFSNKELEELMPGWFIPKDLKRNENVRDRFKENKPGVTPRCKVISKMVHVPTSLWEIKDNIPKWWKHSRYVPSLRERSVAEITNRVVLIGKVVGKGRAGFFDVAFVSNKDNDEVSEVRTSEIRKYIIPDGMNSEKKKKAMSRREVNVLGDSDDDEDDEDLVEIDEFMSEDDLQEDDGSDDDDDDDDDEEEDSDDDEEESIDPALWIRKEPRTKIDREWKVVDDVRSTNYTRPITPSHVNEIPRDRWNDITNGELFLMQLPMNELNLWTRLTSKSLLQNKKTATTVTEMKSFIGVLFCCTMSRKVGGITKVFETISDGLFPPQNIGRFGLKLRRFQTIMSCWEFSDKEEDGVDLDDEYWKTESLFRRFNTRYKQLVTHGTYVNVDERIFWSYTRNQPGGIKICGRKPKGTGQECKTLSCCDMNVTTTFEHVRGNAKTPYTRELMKEYGKAASVVLRLCKMAGIEGSNRIVIADSWFANLSLFRGLRMLGLHLLGMIKQGDGGFPKLGLCKLLDKDEKARGSHVTAVTEINLQKVIALAWKGKSDKGNKGRKKKFWMSTFIASDCTTTLPGTGAEKKRHTKDGKRAASVFVPRPKLVEAYYNGMPGTDIVNRNAQFLIGVEEAVRTNDIHKRMCCTVLGTWMANAYGMAMKNYSDERKAGISIASFTKDVILQSLFPPQQQDTSRYTSGDSVSSISHCSTIPEQRAVGTVPGAIATPAPLGTSIDRMAIDPYVHTMHRFADRDVGCVRQQRCVMCHQEGRRQTTTFYCSLCTVTANKESDRKPSKHAYCIKPEYNCFARHIAQCYLHMNQTGMMAQRTLNRSKNKNAIPAVQQQVPIPIAGRIVSRAIPKRRKNDKRGKRKCN